jgi:hypothetical protein
VVEHLLSKHEAMSSNTSTFKINYGISKQYSQNITGQDNIP